MGLTKAYCPARTGMKLETLDIKLHFFFFSWPAPTFCFETTVFIRWEGGKIFSFKLAGNFSSGGYPLPPAHINHAFGQALCWNTEGRRGEISLDLTPRRRQNGCHCASAGIPPWLNATYSCWGSNQGTPLLAGSKGIFIDTLALTLAQGSALSAGGPGLLLSLPDIFSAWALSYVIIYTNLWTQPIQPQVQGVPFWGEDKTHCGSERTGETSY